MLQRRRALVLADESARHPFRRTLPPHVFKPIGDERENAWRTISLRDWRDFIAAYCASFVAVTIFIA